ncbi:16S rRNA (cytidine(1402)-2'-O)-methyltransferase [Acetobacter tropicalis]|uniref:16S rRNA (cytidine(1402)-2'-O)-methyltransferase n=1 Tax=Acetobacter tropicalis TaxID=104102 RepID=UPI000556F55C|nr:16S rRNA (cytidine(1402)-2'-O)-methyltransferase [Acetobacter tropicalis]KAA8389151.1 16S rRNA (cytidine(1402)-2'-O)-methyltransferase [Acetobacter tropicalis]KAA8392342.1 16S rRNA (cytidine(1402)-2'-O)-methyltransferase [Acetobacter tropicalis]MBC9008400.1 16S rRNA (cytidine(1402)-2'-O)-methyltransferase [Acetobacter tropicalis]MDO8170409.1 16S rRNA (cytidine(1402)-2'-O)-methyltransferase [Acetobacter tropicalis]
MSSSSSSSENNRSEAQCDRDSLLHSEGKASSHAPRAFSLTLVATPIGNLGDFSPRAAQALAEADLVLCEDTRTTARLLSENSIFARTEALHEHNERQRVPALIERLQNGTRIALVSDAGMPLLSDPGYRLVRAAIEADIPLTVIPGPNAALTALVLSGLPPHPFMFVGFPPPRSAARKEAFAKLHAAERAGLAATLIWHEAPHRLAETLADMAEIFGPTRPCAVARELTKRFEEVRRAPVADLAAFYAETPPRGEITVLLGPAEAEETSADDLDTTLRSLLETHSVKDAAALAATAAGLPRRTVYARALELAAERKAQNQP